MEANRILKGKGSKKEILLPIQVINQPRDLAKIPGLNDPEITHGDPTMFKYMLSDYARDAIEMLQQYA
ncbi:hypothetical protein JW711_01285 [Candidatus Woesearchaeota archaeon]|nr:hypothetical protein [Candidatus Woesearchaeota archaeon]